MNGLLQQEKLDALGRSLIHLAAKVEAFRNAAAQPLGYNHLEALVSLQLRLGSLRCLCTPGLGSILGGVEQTCMLYTLRWALPLRAAAREGPGWPPLPLISPCGDRGSKEGSAAGCHLLLQTPVLAAFHADELSVLLPLFPPAAPPSLSPKKAFQMHVQTAGRCSGCFPDCPGTGQPALLPQYLGSQIHEPLESSQVHPALRKPSRNKVHICEADSYGAKCLYPAQRPFWPI